MVEFIKRNPAPAAFRRTVRGAEESQAHESRQRRSRFDLDDAERRQSNELARDAAIRETLLRAGGGGDRQSRSAAQGPVQGAVPQGSGVPQGGNEGLRGVQAGGGRGRRPSDLRGEMSRSLARVPGAGAEAANLSLAALESDQQLVRRVFELAATGDPRAAIAFAAQNGEPVPPQLHSLLQDRAVAGSMARIFAQADKMFPGAINARRKLEFVQSSLKAMFTELRGGQLPSSTADAQRAAQSTVPAEVPAPKPGRHQLFSGGTGKPAVSFNQGTGEARRVEGISLPQSAGSRGGGRMSVFEQKRQAFLSVFPGDMQGALEYAQGRRSMNDTELQLAAQRLATQEMRGRFPAASPDDIDARARQIFDVLQSTNILGARSGGGSPGFTPDPNAAESQTTPPNFTPVPGAPRSEAETPAPTATASPRPSRRPKVGDTVMSNGRKLKVTRVLGGGRVEVEDPTTGERFTAKVK